MSINDSLEKGMEDTRASLNFLNKFNEGDTRVRILTEGAVIAQHFFGKGIRPSICYGISKGCPFHKSDDNAASVKYSCYILDRTDNSIKLADLPYSVIKKIGDLQLNSEWAFDTFPMPYDVTVTHKPKESPANMYSVVGSPKRDVLDQTVLTALDELMKSADPAKLIENKKAKQLEEHKASGIWKAPGSDLTDAEKARMRQLRGEDKTIEIDVDAQGNDNINPDDIPF